MRREGLIYALAFLAIVGVGALIILPRLNRDRPAEREGFEAFETAPREAGPAVEAFEARPEYPWVAVRVRGLGVGLRGPLREVLGAEVEVQTEHGAGEQRLRLRATAPVVAVGAEGHLWKRLPAAGLTEGLLIELREAAPPVVVRVREMDGSPAANVPVRVEPAAPGPLPRTDDGGTLVLDALPRGLAVLDPNTSMRRGPRVRLRVGSESSARIVLEPVWRVRGRVLTPEGAPAAGARIQAFGPTGNLGSVSTAGADGAFTWAGPAVVRLSLVVRAAGWGEERFEAAPPATGALVTDLGDLTLESAGVSLVGTVRAAFQDAETFVTVEPVVAAPLREVFGAGQVLDVPRRERLGSDGRFRIDDLPAGLPLRVSVRGAGVPVDAIVEGVAGEEIEVVLEPPPGEKLLGVLRLPSGAPAAGTRLLLSTEPRDGDGVQPGDLEVLTGADGSFLRRGLVGRTFFLRSYSPGHRSLLQRITLPLAEPLALQLETAVTDATRRIRGRVHLGIRTEVERTSGDPWVGTRSSIQYGAPLAGVRVRAAGITALTDAAGRFTLDGVESLAPTVRLTYGFQPGDAVEVDPRPFVAAHRIEVSPGGEPLALVLPTAASLRMRLLDGLDDTPMAFVHVVLQTDEGRTVIDRGFAPRDGVVEIAGLPPRGTTLTVIAKGCRFRKAPLMFKPGQQLDLGDVLMVHGMRIEGRVLGPEGRPLPGARIGAYGKGWQHTESDPGLDRELLFRTAVTDTNGNFILEGFNPRKPADLAIWASGLAPTAVRVELPKFSDVIRAETEVTLERGAFLALDLHAVGTRRGPGMRVHGALVDVEHAHDGTDWLDLLHRGLLGGPAASSAAWRSISRLLLYERRGVDGYIVGPLRPAPYILWVERPGFAVLRSKLTVIDPKQTILVDVGSGRERKFKGRVTRLQFELEPAR